MRTLRLCVCLLVSGTLFILGGCKKAGVKSEVHDVAISNCVATPEWVTVHEGDQVDWQAGDHDYTIRFSDRNEPTANPVTVTHGASHHPHPIHGHSGCEPKGNGEFYCKYSLNRDNEPNPCADPGIHIIP
jgi:plastocyanin